MTSVATEEKFNNFQSCAILSRNKALLLHYPEEMLCCLVTKSHHQEIKDIRWNNVLLQPIFSYFEFLWPKYLTENFRQLSYAWWSIQFAEFMLEKKGWVRSERTHYFVLGPSSLLLFVKEIKTKETIETKSFINFDVYPFMMPDTRKWHWYNIL